MYLAFEEDQPKRTSPEARARISRLIQTQFGRPAPALAVVRPLALCKACTSRPKGENKNLCDACFERESIVESETLRTVIKTRIDDARGWKLVVCGFIAGVLFVLFIQSMLPASFQTTENKPTQFNKK